MNITLSPETQKLIERKMACGGYATPDEVVMAALRALDTDDDFSAAGLETLRKEIEVGLRDFEEGRSAEWNKDEIREAGMRLLEQDNKAR